MRRRGRFGSTRGAGGVAAVAEGVRRLRGDSRAGPRPATGAMNEDRPRLRCRRFPAVQGAGLSGSPAAALGAAYLLAFLGLLAAIGIAVDGDDLGVVDEAVDQGDDAGGVGEGLAPLGERPVGGDDGGSFPAPARDDVEQQVGMAVAVGAYILSLTDRFAGCRGPVLVAMRSPKSGFSGHGPLCYVRTD